MPETDLSPNLGLPFYQTKLNEFEVQHNEALLVLDALVMLSVIDRDLTAPPAESSFGDRYLVKAVATGDFAGKENRIAQYDIGGWNFYAPKAGWTCYVQDEQVLLAFNGEAWEPALDVLGGVSELQNVSLLGIGTEADAVNPLAAKLNNVLWAARTVAEGGDGTLRYKLSKEDASTTLSLLFQDNYSGRAELGLAGDDDFRIKVSADGADWLDAIVIDRTTGEVSLPQTPPAGAPADLDILLAQLALGQADALNCALFVGASGNRFADSFDALTWVDTGGSAGLDTGTAGLLKPGVSGSTSYANAGGTGDRTASITVTQSGLTIGGGTINNLVDGGFVSNTSDSMWISGTPSAGAYLRFDFGSGNVKYIDEFKWYQPAATAALGTWKWRASNDATGWTDLGSTFTLAGSAMQTQAISHASPAAYRYYQLEFVSGTIGTNWQGEIEFKISASAPAPANLTAKSTALPAAAAPASAKLVAQTKHIDSIVLGTDLMFDVSRDGGTTWSTAAMNDRFTVNSIHVLESDVLDLSGQPSGTSMKWCVRTANDKMVEVHGLALYWS